MGYGALDYKPITKVFAFKKGSINTDYMAGDNLEPTNSEYNPFFKKLYKGIISALFPKKNIEKKFS